MITIEQLTELLGWAVILNIGYLFLATLSLLFMRDQIIVIHQKMFNMDEKELISKYFNFLSFYKVMTLVLIVAPYLALKIMGY